MQAHRSMLFGVAYRLLGSKTDADDVLQDAYLRWRGVPVDQVREPRRYLTRIVTRLAIDRMRDRQRRESYVGTWLPEPLPTGSSAVLPGAVQLDPLDSVEQRDTIATATLYLMERLDPLERAVFVLRTAFELPYAEIADIVERSEEHCRQLHRRASRRLAEDRRRFTPSRQEHAQLVERFLRAARDGDLATLRDVLHDDVVTWSDGGGKVKAARNEIVGAERVVRFFAGILGRNRNPVITGVELNGTPGAVVAYQDGLQVVTVAVTEDRISAVFLVSNPDKLTPIRGAVAPSS
nr:RNA polymerase sigma factor SigJ [Phytoactinopolyspora alkaliphila]